MISGQKTVTTAGSAEILGTQLIVGPLIIKALDTNTGVVAIGNDGANDVTLDNGYRLQAGDSIILAFVTALSTIYLDSSVNGEGVCWMSLHV